MRDTTSKDYERLERLRDLLEAEPCYFFVVYRRLWRPLSDLKLRWCRASSRNPQQNRKMMQEMAARYQREATLAFRCRRTFVQREVEGPAGGRFRNWHGLKLPLNPGAGQAAGTEVDTGRRYVFVGGGAIRRAGYVVVVCLATSDTQEVQAIIGRMQAIWAQAETARQPALLRRLNPAICAVNRNRHRIIGWAMGAAGVSFLGWWCCMRADRSGELSGLGVGLEWIFTVVGCVGLAVWAASLIIWQRPSREDVATAVEMGLIDPTSLSRAGRVDFYLSYGSLPKWLYMPFLVVGVGMAVLMVLGLIGMVIHVCL